jgi:hypothetical protein
MLHDAMVLFSETDKLRRDSIETVTRAPIQDMRRTRDHAGVTLARQTYLNLVQ